MTALHCLRSCSHVTGFDSYPGTLYADRPCVHTFPSLSRQIYPSLSGGCLSTFESGEQIYPVNNSPSPDTCEQPVQSRIRKDMYERKDFPHKVCPDRNRIRLRVNRKRIYPDTCDCYSYLMKLSSDRMG